MQHNNLITQINSLNQTTLMHNCTYYFCTQGTCKCSQTSLVKIMIKFTEEQKEAVNDAGLGSLLNLKDLDIRHDLCKSIANTFDLETGEFYIRRNRFKLTIPEVYHILGLPSEGNEIYEPPKKHIPSLFAKHCSKDGNKAISVNSLKEYLNTNETHGEDFVRNFVLYAIGFYLCPTLQPYVKSEYLDLVEDVDETKNLNWSSLVLNFLIASIREYRQGKVNLKGNLALLQVSQYSHDNKESYFYQYTMKTRHLFVCF